MSEPSYHPPYRYTAAVAGRIETAWQDRWEREGTFHTPNPTGPLGGGFDSVAMRPPPVRAGHVPVPERRGTARRPPAWVHRHRRVRPVPANVRFTVLHTMGFDAFGLPAEQYAVETGRHPRVDHRGQHRDLPPAAAPTGLGHDQRRSVATTDVEFYRWTQWIFLQVFDAWYDPDAARARPVAELVAELDAGVRRPAEGTNPSGRPWAELTGSSAGRSSTLTDWRTGPTRSSTGAPAWAPCWPTRRSPRRGAASAATSRSIGGR